MVAQPESADDRVEHLKLGIVEFPRLIVVAFWEPIGNIWGEAGVQRNVHRFRKLEK